MFLQNKKMSHFEINILADHWTQSRDQVDVKRAPFGWYKEFEIRGKGHPLADLSMTICPYEGTECNFTCPYCHHPFKEVDAEHVCQQSAECTGTCSGKQEII